MEMFTFGPFLRRCRYAFLDELQNRRNALVLGDGDGRFTARLLEENQLVLIDAIDASPAMLRALLHNVGLRTGRVRVHLADIRQWQPEGPRYDLIVTHFFLDCLSTKEIVSLASKLKPCAKPGALWVVSEFAIPPGWYGWLVARPVVSALYVVFWLMTGLTRFRLPKYQKALTEAGFTLRQKETRLGGLLVSELWTPETSLPDSLFIRPELDPDQPAYPPNFF
jgi:hypothetical protein